MKPFGRKKPCSSVRPVAPSGMQESPMWVWLLHRPGMITRVPFSIASTGSTRSTVTIVSALHSKRLHIQGSRPGPRSTTTSFRVVIFFRGFGEGRGPAGPGYRTSLTRRVESGTAAYASRNSSSVANSLPGT